MILNVRHTGIVVNNLKNQIQFYESLGFKEFCRDEEEGFFIEKVTGIKGTRLEWIKMKAADGFVLELLQYKNDSLEFDGIKAPSNKLGCSHIAFTVDNIAVVCEHIKNKGGSVVNDPVVSPDGKVRVAYCHDPEGVLMEIVELI